MFSIIKKNIIEKKGINIVLLVHNNPDGDALGSALALLLYFKKLEHNVFLISPTKYSKFYSWMPKIEDIIVFSKKKNNMIRKIVINSDYIFFIDFNNLSRINECLKEIINFPKKPKKILIDHHPLPSFSLFDIFLHDIKSSATTMLVFKFISNIMNHFKIINEKIATCLYIGLMTDTGNFRFSSITYKTHFIAGKLIKKGANVSNIYNKLQEKYNESQLKLLSIALYRIKIIQEYNIAYTFINYLETVKYNYEQGDVDGIVSYGLRIKNVVLSVFFFEEKKNHPIKISFRSKGDLDVNLFARKYFNGGGHKNASGGKLRKSLLQSIQYFLNTVSLYYKKN